ncbi:hypothetical protein EBT31_00150 [bacterium]|nr:hypothetical protein [bacterium]
MGYTSFKELAGKSGSVNSSYQRQYTRQFRIITDDATHGPYYVGSHPSLPLIFSAYPDDANAFCVSLSPQQDSDNPLAWTVTAQYAYAMDSWAGGGGGVGPVATGNPQIDSQQKGQPPASRASAPLSRPRDYSFQTINVGQRVVEKDVVTNEPIVNTAGDPIAPPYLIDIPAIAITIGLNSTTAPGDGWVSALGKINTNTLTIGTWIIAAKRARLRGISANLVYEEGLSYWRWQINFEVRYSWKWDLRSVGLEAKQYARDGAGNQITVKGPIKKNGRYITQPTGLDSNGFVAENTKAGGVWTDNAAQLSFDVIESTTFPSPL